MDTMNVQFLESVCRTCMQELAEMALITVDFKPVLTWKSMFETIMESDMLSAADLLSKTMPQIKVKLNDNLPKKICSECLEKLVNSYRFQQMCLQNEQKLHELLAKKKVDTHMTIEEASKISRRGSSQVKEESPLVAIGQGNDVMSMNNSLPAVYVGPAQNGKEDIDDGVDDGFEHSDSDDSVPINRLKEEILATVVPDNGPSYPCPICNKNFSKDRNMKCHMKRMHKSKQADTVQKQSDKDSIRDKKNPSSSKSVEKCEEQVALVARTYECHNCHKIFSQIGSLKTHMKRKKCNPMDPDANKKMSKEDKCEICGKRSSNLTMHKYWAHPGLYKLNLPKYNCEICGKGFSKSFTLKEHMHVHTGERPNLCQKCGKSFRTVGLLRDHILRHSEKTVQCPQCPSKFYLKSDWNKHNFLVHEGVKQHVCDICGMAFYKPYQLTKHRKRHTGEKPFKCDYCDMRFAVSYGRKRHMRTHTGEKPFKCEYCDFAFAQKVEKMFHLRLHLGKNVYRCELCPANFQKFPELREHTSTHVNDDEETRERNMKALKEEEAKLPKKLETQKQKTK